MTGPVGVFYRQFALTMAMSIVLSGVVALTLTPVLCAMLLKPHSLPSQRRSLIARLEQGLGKRITSLFGTMAPWILLFMAASVGTSIGIGSFYLIQTVCNQEQIGHFIQLSRNQIVVISSLIGLSTTLTVRSRLSIDQRKDKPSGLLSLFLYFFIKVWSLRRRSTREF